MPILLFLLLVSIALFSQDTTKPNMLISEHSPYLQQHAYNPVAWYPWGDKAFSKAKREDKLIFLSIGYSTCHWCHVMAKESFENSDIATLLKRDYISIKVDRETLPHVDSYYQQRYRQLHHKNGGWPLHVILDANQKILFMAGYIPIDDKYGVEGLRTLLPKWGERNRKAPQEIAQVAQKIEKALQQKEQKVVLAEDGISVQGLMHSVTQHFDPHYYGFSEYPKFPEASRITLLFDLGLLGQPKAEQMALSMLRIMALRGLYDQVEGGFFRYSTDQAWEIPHFEKMLYNQAELIPLYVRAYALRQDPLYKQIVEETIVMTQHRFEKEGLYFAASNADTHHQEGAYFIFDEDEVEKALVGNPHKEELLHAIHFEDDTNFGRYFHINLFTNSRIEGFEAFRQKLQQVRSKREYPFIDKKVITAWNAMMVEALYSASFLDKRYLVDAEQSLEALLKMMYRDEVLFHQTLFGYPPQQEALLEDYSALISALIAAYEVTYDQKRLELAGLLAQKAIFLFSSNGRWVQADDTLQVEVSLNDKYYTSAFAKMMQNLLRLAALQDNRGFHALAKRSLTLKHAEIIHAQDSAPASARALLMQKYGVVVIKHDKGQLQAERAEIQKIAYPFVLTKAVTQSKAFLACEVDRCFAYDEDLGMLIKKIELRARP